VRRRYEPVEEYAPGNEDYEYDEWRQRRDDERELDEIEAHAEDARRTAAKRAASGISPELLFNKEPA
jgi:hypothetical protein